MNPERKRNIFIWLRIFISLGLLGILAAFADVGNIWHSLCGFRIVWFPIVFGLIALSMLISAVKWGVLLSAQDIKIGLGPLFGIYISALFFNNFLPSSIGGDGVRILLAGRHSGHTAAAAASVVVERTLACVSLAMLGLIGAVLAQHPTPFAVWLLGVLLVIGIMVTVLLLTGWLPTFIKKKDGKFWRSIVSFSEAAGGLKERPDAIILCFLLSLIFQSVVAGVVASIIGGLGLPLPGAGDLAYVTSASSVLSMVPVGINGYGLREGAYILLLQPLGFTTSSALTVSVLFAVLVSIFSLGGAINWMWIRSAPGELNIKEELS